MPVRVRFPSEAHESLLEEILRGIFVLCEGRNMHSIELQMYLTKFGLHK